MGVVAVVAEVAEVHCPCSQISDVKLKHFKFQPAEHILDLVNCDGYAPHLRIFQHCPHSESVELKPWAPVLLMTQVEAAQLEGMLTPTVSFEGEGAIPSTLFEPGEQKVLI